MASKKVDALEGEMEQFKTDIEERYLGLAERFSSMENHFGSMEDMLKKLVEMQTRAPPAFPSGEQKGKGVQLEEDEVESVHPHNIPPRRPTEGGYGPYGGGTAREIWKKRRWRGGGAIWEVLWARRAKAGSGEGWAEPWRANERRGEREYWRDPLVTMGGLEVEEVMETHM